MNNTYTEEHTENAIDLYELRLSWLNETDIHANALEGVEERLCANLYHCARSLPGETTDDAQTDKKKEPKKEAECFVFLASHITSSKPAISNAGYELAYQWLTQDAAKSAAAESALTLYPSTDETALIKLYEEHEVLRPALFRLFRKQMHALPLAMVNTAATAETSSTSLKTEALNYAAANPEIGPDVFRNHYLPLLSGQTQFDAAIVEAALWGGLLRGDADATRAISAAISHINSAKDRAPLLRLAALTGAAEYLPLLLQAAENDPVSGYNLLTLYGQKSVIPALLKAMESVHTMEAAATAFTQLCDQNLRRIPRLTVVGKEETDDAEDNESEKIPDVIAARAWWDKNQTKWKTEERWLAGKPATPAHLQKLTKKYAASYGRDVMALLALVQKSPLNIASETWRARQQSLLAEMSAAKPVNKSVVNGAAQSTVKPASARHA